MHQIATFEQFVDVHRVQTGGIKARQPHVADDNELEAIFGIFKPFGEVLTLAFIAVVSD